MAAASRSELNAWTEYVGECMTELAFGDLQVDEGLECYAYLIGLCHAVPELRLTCAGGGGPIGFQCQLTKDQTIMAIQLNTASLPQSSPTIPNEVAVYKSPLVFFIDAGEMNYFIDLLSGKISDEKVPYIEELAPRKFGAWKGKVWMAPDFDDDQEIIELFEGSELSPDGDD